MRFHRILFLLSKKYRNNKIIRKLALPFWKYSYKIRRRQSIKAFKSFGEEAIRTIFQNLNAVELPIWLEFGTLLGAYRNNDFIPNDIDIDLGAYIEDEHKIDKFLKCIGFKLVREFKLIGENFGLERTYSYRGVFVDIFFFTKDKDTLFTYEFEKNDQKDNKFSAVRLNFEDSGIELYSFKGISVFIPVKAQKHLAAHYGEHFMIPDPNFSDKNAPNRIDLVFEYFVTYEEFL